MASLYNVLVHVPHSGLELPKEDMKYFIRSDKNMEYLAYEIADIFADRLFDIGADMLVCQISRLVVDVERFLDDSREVMASRGLGAIYKRYYDGTPIRFYMNDEEKAGLIRKYYIPHHKAFESMVRDKLDKFGFCRIIDGHSFSDTPFRLDLDQSPGRPDICIGTDSIHTPKELREKLIDGFTSKGYSVKENSPYSGTIVPVSMYGDTRISSVMIEVNKKLYMNGLSPMEDMINKLRQDIKEIIL